MKKAATGVLALAALLTVAQPALARDGHGHGDNRPTHWHDDRGGITVDRVHRILTRAGYGPILSVTARESVFVAETYDTREQFVRVRIDRWSGKILAVRFIDHGVPYETVLIDRARESLKDLGFRRIEFRKSVDGVLVFDAIDARGRDSVIRVGRRSGDIVSIDYRGRPSGGRDRNHDRHVIKTVRDIERIIYGLGYDVIVRIDKEGDCYVARAHKRHQPTYELRLDADSGRLLNQRVLAKWET